MGTGSALHSEVPMVRAGSFRVLALLSALAAPTAGLAAPFSVESPTHVSREAADQERKEAIQAGAAPEVTRIVRRYERGAGWRFLVQIDDVATLKQVKALGAVLVDGDRGIRVVDLATGQPVEVAVRAAAKKPAPAPVAAPPAPNTGAEPAPTRRSRREADGVLSAAVVAHGGVDGGLAILERTDTLTFQFIREVPVAGGTLKAKHVYRQSGKARRLDVQVQKGAGVDSTTVIAPDGGAWVVTGDQTVPRDTARTAEIIGRFAPDQLLRVALGVAADIESANAWRTLAVVGPEGDDLVVLQPEDGTRSDLVEVAFSRADHRLRRLVLRDQGRETVYYFDDYREIQPGLVIPHEAEVQRDGNLQESLQVVALDVTSTIPGSLFSPAAK